MLIGIDRLGTQVFYNCRWRSRHESDYRIAGSRFYKGEIYGSNYTIKFLYNQT